MKRILLDTNAYARFFGGDEGVLGVLGEAETVYLSAIVLGEFPAYVGSSPSIHSSNVRISVMKRSNTPARPSSSGLMRSASSTKP